MRTSPARAPPTAMGISMLFSSSWHSSTAGRTDRQPIRPAAPTALAGRPPQPCSEGGGSTAAGLALRSQGRRQRTPGALLLTGPLLTRPKLVPVHTEGLQPHSEHVEGEGASDLQALLGVALVRVPRRGLQRPQRAVGGREAAFCKGRGVSTLGTCRAHGVGWGWGSHLWRRAGSGSAGLLEGRPCWSSRSREEDKHMGPIRPGGRPQPQETARCSGVTRQPVVSGTELQSAPYSPCPEQSLLG